MGINITGFVILVWALLGTTNLHAQQSQSTDAGKALVSSLEINEGYPSKKTSQRLYDELQFQQAVQVYLWAQPAMSLYSVRQELTKKFDANPTTIPTWKDRVTA
jgi:hypothetical protein